MYTRVYVNDMIGYGVTKSVVTCCAVSLALSWLAGEGAALDVATALPSRGSTMRRRDS